jgi:general secretion pathway protein I
VIFRGALPRPAHPVGVATRRVQSGFSLLEVVVAFSILALTLGVLIQIFSRAVTTTSMSADYSRASTLAEAKLNALGLEVPLEAGSLSGETEDGFAWEVFVEPFELGEVDWEPTLLPYQVTAVASWDDGGGRRRQISIVSLRAVTDSAFAGEARPGFETDSAHDDSRPDG